MTCSSSRSRFSQVFRINSKLRPSMTSSRDKRPKCANSCSRVWSKTSSLISLPTCTTKQGDWDSRLLSQTWQDQWLEGQSTRLRIDLLLGSCLSISKTPETWFRLRLMSTCNQKFLQFKSSSATALCRWNPKPLLSTKKEAKAKLLDIEIPKAKTWTFLSKSRISTKMPFSSTCITLWRKIWIICRV